MTCLECKGTGQIALFTSRRQCLSCGGSGKWPEMRIEDSVSDGCEITSAAFAVNSAVTVNSSILEKCPKCGNVFFVRPCPKDATFWQCESCYHVWPKT